MKYPIAIETGSETTAWGVAVPDLPGCFSAGDSPDEAYTKAREAIELWLNAALDTGQPIPKAKTLEEHMADPEYKGWAWGVIEIDLADFDDTVERINITVPKRVLRQIDKYVAVRHENRSGFLARAALEAIYENA
ncbi:MULTISPECIES: type II toxin-antitoxin system HicB family antitoxin [Rhodanobacter]|uniref:type II toxin-antitoxin system HicB family antitoxin n=1 Tax=Rhodanobacter TaxID=75309 RepID=UPI0003F6BC72|nr:MULTISPECIES: type II toxin-antitoxin system HicB family antitoxin [Rhodanobacter]TAN19381.1 MAG: type II toxin-antitoxin system HicB family antitoxin [Rhodanobacter sp.]UJJ56268.1 type II toxin-antitoxin system HicB family antitoxin [Rhodanobacter thiooxydans]